MSTFEAKVRGISSEGLGVVEHPDGRVFFVAGAWPGDLIECTVERVERRYGYARLEKILSPSADRAVPPCPHQGHAPGSCGGCAWMIGTYPSQLAQKQHRVQHALSRAKLLGEGETALKTIWGSEPLDYRNRAQLKTDGEVLGFVSEGSHRIAPIADCLVMTEPMRERLRSLRASLPRADWRPSPGYDWNFLEIDEGSDPATEPLINRRRPFRQGNSAQNERMRDWLRLKMAHLKRDATVLELFCGSGNFTEVIAGLGFRRTVAVEVSRESVDELRARALPGVEALDRDLFHPAVLRQLPKLAAGAGVMLLDPPRSGCKGIERVVAEMPGLRKVFYVSCDVATFTRDAVALAKEGFALTEAQPLDLFPQTPHVEILAEFTRS